MSLWVKICGNTSLEDAWLAAEAAHKMIACDEAHSRFAFRRVLPDSWMSQETISSRRISITCATRCKTSPRVLAGSCAHVVWARAAAA